MKKTDSMCELMGSVVTVHTELHAKRTRNPSENRRRVWEECSQATPRAGWVVGFRHVQEGVIESGSYYGEYEPAYLSPDKQIPVVLVCYWPTHKPVCVPLDGYTLGGTPEYRSYPWPDHWRESQRIIANETPRDARGRFTK